MTLTLDIPADIDAAKRERLAVALYDAQVISQGRADRQAFPVPSFLPNWTC